MKRKSEYFGEGSLRHKKVVTNAPVMLYPQERDWTCVFACIRTILSGITEEVPGEDCYVENYRLNPGPRYSKDIKELQLLSAYDTIYGCDSTEHDFDTVLDYMEQGYFLMLESMHNYAHWMVLLGYYPKTEDDIEKAKLLMYDPYYDEVKLVNTDEFIGMWRDGDYEHSRVDKDFIAVRK